MQIINTNISFNYKIPLQTKKMKSDIEVQPTVEKSSNILPFENYGRTLVSKPSFKKSEYEEYNEILRKEKEEALLKQPLEPDLSKRISSLLSMIVHPSILLIGNDETKDLALLEEKCENSYYLDFMFKNIYYINDKEIDGPLVFTKERSCTRVSALDEKNINLLDCTGKESINKTNADTYESTFTITRNNKSLLIRSDIPKEELTNPGFKVFEVTNARKVRKFNKESIKELVDKIENKTSSTKEKKADSTKVRTNITFNDIGGLDDVISRIKKEILYPIKMPFAYEKRKKIDHGTILYGAPGTGKSMIGEALANEAGTTYIKINASETEACLVGETEENWRNIFDQAVKNQPCIIFIDEIDAIAKKRGGHDVYGDKALNTILSLLSNIEKNNDRVYVIGATNRIDSIDSALLRKGRFGNHIDVPKPDAVGCYEIFNKHSKNMKIAKEFLDFKYIKDLYKREPTGSDIAAIIDKAWDEAYERLGLFDKMEQNTLTQEDIDDVIITKDDFDNALDMVLPQKEMEN